MDDIENNIFMLSEVHENLNYMIEHNGRDSVNDFEYITNFKGSTIKEFEEVSGLLEKSMVYLECIKLLLSGDIEEEEFKGKVKLELNELKYKL